MFKTVLFNRTKQHFLDDSSEDAVLFKRARCKFVFFKPFVCVG